MITIFRDTNQNSVLAEYQRKFRYLLVDEYQDTNTAQYLWLRLLAQSHHNICCVGDDDQSIYGWRGAEIGNILRFEKDFSEAFVVRLEQNYRSTNHILNGASNLIANNKGRLGKTLWSEQGQGERMAVRGHYDGEQEAMWVGEEIEQLQRRSVSLNHMAILVRAGFQMREFEERLIKLGVSYRVFGGPRFYERQEIRDALAYLRLVAQPNDDLALERIINVPKRGLGDATLQLIHIHARKRTLSLMQAIEELLLTQEFKPKIRATLASLMQDFARWRSLIATQDHAQLAAQILDESGYTAMWQADKTIESAGRLENLKEFVASMEEFQSLPEFLEHVSLVLDAQNTDTQDQFVSLMTLHGAKGLEFDYVFLPGWEEGLFPSQRSLDENGLQGLEEERRLAYVGLTRAKQKAFISFAASRRMYGQWVQSIPSRFIDELPAESIEMQKDNSYSQADYRSGGGYYGSSAGVLSAPPVSTYSRSSYAIGDTIAHIKFGQGRIINIEGHKLDILFEDGSEKRVMDSFVDKI
jgi:DNA helicase-2/ATP-dependent DNA helicase PcrA